MKYRAKSRFTFYDEFDEWNEIPCEAEVEAGNLNEAIQKIISETRRKTLADSYSQPIGVEILEIRDEEGEIVHKDEKGEKVYKFSEDYKSTSKDVKSDDLFRLIIHSILSLPPEKIQMRYTLISFLIGALFVLEDLEDLVCFLKNQIIGSLILIPEPKREKLVFKLISELLDHQKDEQRRLEILPELLESINGKTLVDAIITTLEKLRKLNSDPYSIDEGNMLILELSKKKQHYDIAARLLERLYGGKYYAPEIFEAAQYYEKAGNLEKALEMYQKGIELCSPSHLETYDENTGGYVSVLGNIFTERLYAEEIEEGWKRVEICKQKVKELKRKIAEREKITGKSILRKRK